MTGVHRSDGLRSDSDQRPTCREGPPRVSGRGSLVHEAPAPAPRTTTPTCQTWRATCLRALPGRSRARTLLEAPVGQERRAERASCAGSSVVSRVRAPTQQGFDLEGLLVMHQVLRNMNRVAEGNVLKKLHVAPHCWWSTDALPVKSDAVSELEQGIGQRSAAAFDVPANHMQIVYDGTFIESLGVVRSSRGIGGRLMRSGGPRCDPAPPCVGAYGGGDLEGPRRPSRRTDQSRPLRLQVRRRGAVRRQRLPAGRLAGSARVRGLYSRRTRSSLGCSSRRARRGDVAVFSVGTYRRLELRSAVRQLESTRVIF